MVSVTAVAMVRALDLQNILLLEHLLLAPPSPAQPLATTHLLSGSLSSAFLDST